MERNGTETKALPTGLDAIKTKISFRAPAEEEERVARQAKGKEKPFRAINFNSVLCSSCRLSKI